MRGRTSQLLVFVTALLFAETIFATTSSAAGPRLIMFYGGPLQKPVILADWQENLLFVAATHDEAKVTSRALEGRPYIKVAMFWGPEWEHYVEEGRPLDKIRPDQANQHSRFYPAVDGHLSVFVYGRFMLGENGQGHFIPPIPNRQV